MIDPAARPAFVLLLVCILLSIGAWLGAGFHIDHRVVMVTILWPMIVFAGLLARRIGLFRLSTFLLGSGIAYGQGFTILLFTYSMAALGMPYVDGTLARFDEALGFHWPTYVEATRPDLEWLNAA